MVPFAINKAPLQHLTTAYSYNKAPLQHLTTSYSYVRKLGGCTMKLLSTVKRVLPTAASGQVSYWSVSGTHSYYFHSCCPLRPHSSCSCLPASLFLPRLSLRPLLFLPSFLRLPAILEARKLSISSLKVYILLKFFPGQLNVYRVLTCLRDDRRSATATHRKFQYMAR
jgi:hypothetical protein